MAFKNPDPLINKLTPKFDINKVRDYFTQYGDFVTDDAYKDWALKVGKQLGPAEKDTSGTTYFSQYINDEDFLKYAYEQDPESIDEYFDYLESNPKEAKAVRRWRVK